MGVSFKFNMHNYQSLFTLLNILGHVVTLTFKSYELWATFFIINKSGSDYIHCWLKFKITKTHDNKTNTKLSAKISFVRHCNITLQRELYRSRSLNGHHLLYYLSLTY